jgi:two-component system KDP operon response regulator KdpE
MWSDAPIILVSAVGDEAEKIAALDAGADDYVTKPFSAAELLARLRAVLRRAGAPGAPVVTVGSITVDFDKDEVTVDGRHVHLTPNELRILGLLARNPGKLLTHRSILREVWGPAYGDESNYLHVYVSQLRRKLEPDPARPQHLITEPGAGYRLVDPS